MALLHDIGKIGVPDEILNKPLPLEDEEYRILKQHSVTGGDILKNIGTFSNLKIGALYHHERYDGRGYPDGLAGENIPMEARIIAIADTYDAMTTNRAYRGRLSDEAVLVELENVKGTQLDAVITEVFLEMLNEGFKV